MRQLQLRLRQLRVRCLRQLPPELQLPLHALRVSLLAKRDHDLLFLQSGLIELCSSADERETRQFLQLTQQAVQDLEKLWGPMIRPIRIFLFETRQELVEVGIMDPLPPWVMSYAGFPDLFFQAVGTDPPSVPTLRHEFCHLMIWQYRGERLPAWLEEGVCEALAYPETHLPGSVRLEEIPPHILNARFTAWKVRTLLDLDTRPVADNPAYLKSKAFMQHLLRREGWERVRKFLVTPAPDAATCFFDQDWDRIELEWIESLVIPKDRGQADPLETPGHPF